jgi:glycosyltransferase involved in cell wall biosynthesis
VSVHRRYAAQIHCVNADGTLLAAPGLKRAANPGKYRIGSWFWELERFPAAWSAAFDEIDELWAASPFIEAALSAASPKPVISMPLAVEFALPRAYTRREFGLPEDCFVCLFAYDFHSFGERKNPQAALAAFAQAFPQQRDVALVIKTVGGAQHPDALRRLQELARGDPRVIIRDQVLAREEMLGLQSVCDVFVSLHRSEGFGLALAEAMWLGKPVVATGYSGNLAFMDAANSCLVDYRLVPVREGEYIHGAGQRWAEPDVAHAADWLRRLRQDPGLRQALGARAAQSMRERHSHAAVGARIRQRLEIIAAARRRFAQRR